MRFCVQCACQFVFFIFSFPSADFRGRWSSFFSFFLWILEAGGVQKHVNFFFTRRSSKVLARNSEVRGQAVFVKRAFVISKQAFAIFKWIICPTSAFKFTLCFATTNAGLHKQARWNPTYSEFLLHNQTRGGLGESRGSPPQIFCKLQEFLLHKHTR